MAIKVTMTIEAGRIEGTVDDRPFTISQRFREISLKGIDADQNNFASMFGSKLLDFGSAVIHGLNILVDETDRAEIWEPLNDDLQDQIYEAML